MTIDNTFAAYLKTRQTLFEERFNQAVNYLNSVYPGVCIVIYEAFENEIAEYQELIERKISWANNADARQLLLPDKIFSLALEHTKQKSINKKQLIHKLAKQFQMTPFLIEQELQTRDQKN